MPDALVFVVASEVAELPASGMSAPTFVPAGLGHPFALTSFGWHRMNRTDPVGGIAPGAFVIVTVSVTDAPGWTLFPLGFDNVANAGVALLTVVWADPLALPFNPEPSPDNDAPASGSVVPVPGVTGFVGIWNARIVRLTWQDRFATGPVAGPNVTVDVGVSKTSPVVGFGTLSVNVTPAHGVVLPSPIADSTLKIPGSTSPPRHSGANAPSLHAGVTRTPVIVTVSVSFGLVDVLMIRTLAPKRSPTVTDMGHVGVALPPTPAWADVTPKRRAPRNPAPTLRPVLSRLATWALRITCSSSAWPR